jgi:hypothetical protein
MNIRNKWHTVRYCTETWLQEMRKATQSLKLVVSQLKLQPVRHDVFVNGGPQSLADRTLGSSQRILLLARTFLRDSPQPRPAMYRPIPPMRPVLELTWSRRSYVSLPSQFLSNTQAPFSHNQFTRTQHYWSMVPWKCTAHLHKLNHSFFVKKKYSRDLYLNLCNKCGPAPFWTSNSTFRLALANSKFALRYAYIGVYRFSKNLGSISKF